MVELAPHGCYPGAVTGLLGALSVSDGELIAALVQLGRAAVNDAASDALVVQVLDDAWPMSRAAEDWIDLLRLQ